MNQEKGKRGQILWFEVGTPRFSNLSAHIAHPFAVDGSPRTAIRIPSHLSVFAATPTVQDVGRGAPANNVGPCGIPTNLGSI